MAITEDELNLLMKLSCLTIEGKAMNEFQRDLSHVLDLMNQLRQADTANVPPLANPRDDIQELRKDEITETDRRKEWQKTAPATEAGLYLVPKVVE